MCERIRLEWNDNDEANFQEMKAEQANLEKASQEYISRWPNYCKQCWGWGYISWTEYGQQFMEECECVWTKCPRCGTNNPTGRLDHKDEVRTIVCQKCGFLLHFTDGLQTL
jgi:DNA-directed RNA polymerase subunit RPC12/RpoP